MTPPKLVCPDREEVLQQFQGQAVILRVSAPERLAPAAAMVRESGNQPAGFILSTALPLTEIAFTGDVPDLPLAVLAPALGPFRDLVRGLTPLRRPGLTVHLPCGRADNGTGLRILASLGIRSAADFRDGPADWEALADLATYALLAQGRHADIEPFAFMASHYRPGQRLEWGQVFFDDPEHALHLDEGGRVALSAADLAASRFAAPDWQGFAAHAQDLARRRKHAAWTSFFLHNHPCSRCAGWLLCLGRFADQASGQGGCAPFFQELIDLVHQRRAFNRVRPATESWPP